MNTTAANLIERVLPPQTGLGQWVLTFPFSWRRRLAQDGALLGRLTRIFVETVKAFYPERAAQQGRSGAKTGAVPAAPLEPYALAYDKPLCASLDGLTLQAATRAGALDPAGREALLRTCLVRQLGLSRDRRSLSAGQVRGQDVTG